MLTADKGKMTMGENGKEGKVIYWLVINRNKLTHEDEHLHATYQEHVFSCMDSPKKTYTENHKQKAFATNQFSVSSSL